MHILTVSVIALVALLHLYFLVLEMFFWEKPLGLRTFGLKHDFARASRKLAANQTDFLQQAWSGGSLWAMKDIQ